MAEVDPAEGDGDVEAAVAEGVGLGGPVVEGVDIGQEDDGTGGDGLEHLGREVLLASRGQPGVVGVQDRAVEGGLLALDEEDGR